MTASVLLGVAAAGGLVMAESDSWRPIAAAGGGAILSLNCHWNQLPFPKWLIPTDAGAAVLGFVLLVPATWTARLAG